MSHAAAVKLAAQRREFLEQNFKTYLIICSGVKHILNLKGAISNTYSNMR